MCNPVSKEEEETMTKLYAQPYDISATGFYFYDVETYEQKAKACRNDYGQPVEEFEIHFIDGEQIDCAFAKAFEINQCNFAKFFELVDEWDDQQKTRFIIANGECGYNLNPEKDNIDDLDIDIYDVQSLKELAEQFVDEGLFGEIPKSLEFYIDHEAIARDLAADYSMTEIAGERLAYRCG